jgi:hypothetical protein
LDLQGPRTIRRPGTVRLAFGGRTLKLCAIAEPPGGSDLLPGGSFFLVRPAPVPVRTLRLKGAPRVRNRFFLICRGFPPKGAKGAFAPQWRPLGGLPAANRRRIRSTCKSRRNANSNPCPVDRRVRFWSVRFAEIANAETATGMAAFHALGHGADRMPADVRVWSFSPPRRTCGTVGRRPAARPRQRPT